MQNKTPDKPSKMLEKEAEQLSLFQTESHDPCSSGSGEKNKKRSFDRVEEESELDTLPVDSGLPVRDEPSLEEWGALYKTAADFKDARCWEWMYNDDLFGVIDPETGEAVYCCIMGNLGEHFALGAYLGAEGLQSILDMFISEDDNPDDTSPDLFFRQKCLMASFENRELLTEEDRSVIKTLGLKFRGKNAWPLFRLHEPGYVPWFISAQECRLLTTALQQALVVSLRCRESNEFLSSGGQGVLRFRVPRKAGGQIEWDDQFRKALGKKNTYVSIEIADELRLKKILAAGRKRSGTWEIDTYWLPAPIQKSKGEKPYYPKVFLMVEHSRGLILCYLLTSGLEKEGHLCIETMLDLVEKNNLLPARILVERAETYYLLEQVCRQLQILLDMAPLRRLPEAREAMLSNYLA